MNDMSSTTTIDPEAKDAGRTRKRLFVGLAAVILILGAGYFAYAALIGSRHVETDNAYVGANVAQVTPLINGPVNAVLVDDTQVVHRGDVLIRLDDTDTRNTLAKAEAELAIAEAQVRGLFATDEGLGAQIAARSADTARAGAQLAAARADLARAKIDLDRREALAASGSVSGEELTTARNAYSTALANLKVAQSATALASAERVSAIGTRDANRALIAGGAPDVNPQVLAARATRDQARTDLERTVIRAPIEGVVSGRRVQVGQRVEAGKGLMMVVPVQAAYVDANFKEGQLEKVRPGQPVALTSDLYGSAVKYRGRVIGFSGGSGSAFAVVPAQNATGNWIKVVQRLPVRIALDPAQLAEHPLRVGLSMTVDIDVSN